MTRTTRTHAMLSALVGLLLAGCDAAPSGPATPAVALDRAATAAAAESPNVGEVSFPYVFGIFDEETQLLAVFGLPADPTRWEGCGGTEPAETITLKLVGLKSGLLKILIRDGETSIHVFRTSGQREGEFGLEAVAPFVCETPAIATGTGRVHVTAATGSGGTSVINISLTGTLTSLETGGLVRLTAANKFLVTAGGGPTADPVDGRVHLHPIGRR
jgi:hypothetical protein